MVLVREARGRYRVQIAPEVPVRRSGDLKADLVVNTARFSAAIEAFIRERPDQWFWVHRRWKTRMPLDPRLGSDAGGQGSEPVAARSDRA
jgi:KDO2-lipid IV(A) lauroyltransferase